MFRRRLRFARFLLAAALPLNALWVFAACAEACAEDASEVAHAACEREGASRAFASEQTLDSSCCGDSKTIAASAPPTCRIVAVERGILARGDERRAPILVAAEVHFAPALAVLAPALGLPPRANAPPPALGVPLDRLPTLLI